jgi:hypothetical protein
MPLTVFYSWQSDTRAACNRTLIHDALESALSDVRGMPNVQIEAVLDRDTLGAPGSPDIATVILEKIDRSSAVVADVTLIDAGADGRRFPNPNVLLEVGYAIKSRSFSGLILVMNTHFGPVESLPFDLRGKRVTTYSSPPNADSRASERARLRTAMTTALVETLALDVPVGQPHGDPVDLEVVRRQVAEALSQSPENLVPALDAALAQLDRVGSVQPSEHASLLNDIVAPNLKTGRIPDAYLLTLCDKSIAVHPTSKGHFNRAFVTGKLALPYESIASYMKAISLGDPNPSLCYLNAGNRYRDMNDHAIALSFYGKAVALNPLQAEAWWAAAHLSLTENDPAQARQYFSGFLRWFDGLSTEHRTPAFAQRAEVARAAIAQAEATTTASSATNV